MNSKDPAKPQIIIGALNNGPVLPSVGFSGKMAENYLKLEEAGFVDANIESPEPFATWSPSELPELFPELAEAIGGDNALDHVMVRYADTSNPRRLLEETVTFVDEGFNDGNPFELHLSDHYGL